MENKTKKVKIKSTGNTVEVYKSSTKADTWINANDCKTEYHKDQIEFI